MRRSRYTEEQIVGHPQGALGGAGHGGALPPRHQPADVLPLEGEVRRFGHERRPPPEGAGGREPAPQAAGRRPLPGQRRPEGRAVKKLVRPAVRRSVVRYLGEEWTMSERHACGLLDICRATVRYQARSREDGLVRQRLVELAALRKRFGYRRLGLLLRREGMVVNHKRVFRLYREEGLSLRRRKRKRLRGEGRGPGELATGPDQVWSVDFMSDALAPGRRLKLLTVVDTFKRESLAIEVDTSISGEQVALLELARAALAGALVRVLTSSELEERVRRLRRGDEGGIAAGP